MRFKENRSGIFGGRPDFPGGRTAICNQLQQSAIGYLQSASAIGNPPSAIGFSNPLSAIRGRHRCKLIAEADGGLPIAEADCR